MTPELLASFTKQFPNGPTVHADFQIPAGDPGITVLFGPSGAGKTCILRCLAGLLKPEHGLISLGDQAWLDSDRGIWLPPQKRQIGYLSQDYALFPHLRVAQNIDYGLRGLPVNVRTARVDEVINLLSLSHLQDRYPAQLSGGEQQRVALARAVARRPKLVLLDEPLSALDAPMRETLRRELRELLLSLRLQSILVTHDRLEALALGDRLIVIDKGKILQHGAVLDVFNQPATADVARIVGVDTVEPATVLTVNEGIATVSIGAAKLQGVTQEPLGQTCYVCLRAEEVILEHGPVLASSARNRLPARVLSLLREGPLVRITLDAGFRLTALVTPQAIEELKLTTNSQVIAVIKAPSVHLVPHSGLALSHPVD